MILDFSDPDYRFLVPKTSERVRSNLDLLITPSFCTGDVTTVAYRYDLEIDLILSSVSSSPYDVKRAIRGTPEGDATHSLVALGC